jgi:hypothetical protein
VRSAQRRLKNTIEATLRLHHRIESSCKIHLKARMDHTSRASRELTKRGRPFQVTCRLASADTSGFRDIAEKSSRFDEVAFIPKRKMVGRQLRSSGAQLTTFVEVPPAKPPKEVVATVRHSRPHALRCGIEPLNEGVKVPYVIACFSPRPQSTASSC